MASQTAKRPTDPASMVRQAVEMPADMAAEQAILGAMLLSADAIAAAAESMSEEDFFSPRHAALFGAMVDMYIQRQPVDPVTVHAALSAELRESVEVGDLVALMADTPTISNIARYAAIVREKSIRRRIIVAASRTASLAKDESLPTAKIVDDIYALLDSSAMTLAHRSDRPVTAQEIVDKVQTIGNVARDRVAAGDALFIPTTIDSLDKLLYGGLKPGKLTVLGGSTSIGKTALALQIARSAAEMGFQTMYFSLELSDYEIGLRLAASSGVVPQDRLESLAWTGNADDCDALQRFRDSLTYVPLYVVPSPQMSITALRTYVRQMSRRAAVELVVVDYLQLMTGDEERRYRGFDRYQEIGQITAGLRSIAQEYNVPVLALSQVNRNISAQDRRPVLSDLRESGNIEQDADVVLMLHRPSLDAVMGEIIVAKHRNGPTGTVNVWWSGANTTYSEDTTPRGEVGLDTGGHQF